MRGEIRKFTKLLYEGKYILMVNVFDRIFSFVIFLLLARKFSYENYGEVVTCFTIATILTTILDLGLPAYIQRETSIDKKNASAVFSNVFIIYLLMIIPFSGISYMTIELFFANGLHSTISLIIFLSMYISSLINVCNKTLSGMFDFKSQLIAFSISRMFILIFFLAGMYYMVFDLSSLLCTILIGFFLHLIILFWHLDKNSIKLNLKLFDIKFSKFIIKTTLPLGAAIIINFLYDKIDVLLISKLLDFSKVALYNVGYGIYKTSTLTFSFILVSGYSRVSFLSRSRKGVYLFLKKYSFIIVLICLVTANLVIFFSKPIIHIFYSSKYEESIQVLKILTIGILGLGLNNLTGVILNGVGCFKTVMYITLFGLIVNVILNILFIPRYGIIGAAVITVITEYFIFFFEFYYLNLILDIKRVWKYGIPPQIRT